MSHELYRITHKLYNTPHLINQSSFDSLLGYLDGRNDGAIELSLKPKRYSQIEDLEYDRATRTGFLDIRGPLTYEQTSWTAMCGQTSYQGLVSQFEVLAEAGAQNVVFVADSGGGEAYGVFQCANKIKALANEYGIKTYAYVDGAAASACYALVSACDEIIVNPDAEVGSIGVVVKLVNTNPAMQKAGVEVSYVHAGKSKIPFDEGGSFREGFIQSLQVKVDCLYQTFCEHVAHHRRKLTVSGVQKTDAEMFMAKDAVRLGLADAIMTSDEFFNHLKKSSNSSVMTKATAVTTKAETPKLATINPVETRTIKQEAGVRAIFEEKYRGRNAVHPYH